MTLWSLISQNYGLILIVGRKSFYVKLSNVIHDLTCVENKGHSVFADTRCLPTFGVCRHSVFADLFQLPIATGLSSAPVSGWSPFRGK